MNNLYLSHHGILGQRKGKRNGPPYPLDYSKLSAEEKAQAKEKAIREGNVKEAHSNRVHFTDQELKAVQSRYNLNTEIAKLATADIENGKKKVEKMLKNLDFAVSATEKGIKAYNTMAKVSNSLLDTNYKLIKDSKPDSGKSYVDQLTLPDGTKRTITVKNATDAQLRDISGYQKKKKEK